MERYICIHGHFYQPPRESPWLEAVESQDSAYPYHDWNERITAECYEPNTAARMLDEQNRIVEIANNYARISFNVGPTLLAWMEEKAPTVYHAVLDADRESLELFNGHGSAMAQCYNHIIMPLANSRDKRSQIIWGIRDFEWRFGRKPEGMWLPETAVDLESLDIMAEQGILFTILEPHQAYSMRRIGDKSWDDVIGGRIDPTRPYRVPLASGRSIVAFFYDGPVSRAVAFERLLASGETFAHRIAGTFNDRRQWPQVANIATDGETYGHHHRHGDMALAYALSYIEDRNLARLTNYAAYLAKHPPTHECQIVENTSWSCVHGVERWRSNCGCNSGGKPGWHQEWRAPLRVALDWLRDTLSPKFQRLGRKLFSDPWAARDEYISVILDRSPEQINRFLKQHAARTLSPEEQIQALKLMEMQRHAMLMYTSCGWFFDDLGGIETVQVIQYAGRVIQLAQELFGDGIERQFQELLERAKSNVPEQRDGRLIYDRNVRPMMVDLLKVGAHYAMSSLFDTYEEHEQIYCYTVERIDQHVIPAGRARLLLGRADITSIVTRETATVSYAVLHLGDHNLSGGVSDKMDVDRYEEMVAEVTETFQRADIPGVLRMVDHYFGAATYSLKLLFHDEQRRILNIILDSSLAEAEQAYRQIYEYHAPLMRFLASLDMPVPREFQIAAEFALNTDLRRAMEEDFLALNQINGLLKEAARTNVQLDTAGLSYALEHTIARMTEAFQAQPNSVALLQQLEDAVGLARSLPFEVDIWKTQNVYYQMWQHIAPEFQLEADEGFEDARTWLRHFIALGKKLHFRVG
ncbi:MAG: DUF3536 domain-containing protein [Chloroflexaceae bacterium]|jgi:alpha-amylase/alpha-mannosidase (GH57 family)|nr:DUF3536 domain-containing protein [Chloroflexaceae bacterium]